MNHVIKGKAIETFKGGNIGDTRIYIIDSVTRVNNEAAIECQSVS